MNRRHFFRQLASGLIVAATPTIFLPPRGGWHSREAWLDTDLIDWAHFGTSDSTTAKLYAGDVLITELKIYREVVSPRSINVPPGLMKSLACGFR